MAFMEDSSNAWWQGKKGEWYVVLQIILFAVVLFGPRTALGLPPWAESVTTASSFVGGVLIAIGGFLVTLAAFRLGPNLTPLPTPKDDSTLVVTGPYRLVRHPIYGGIILMAFGWALWVHSWLTLIYAVALAVFMDIKSRREEIWLLQRFPAYPGYQAQVRKLIPFIY